jgi:hypothetical protein
MTSRENQHRLDQLAMLYLAAVESADFDVIDALWERAAQDAQLTEMLHGLNVEAGLDHEREEAAATDAAVLRLIEQHLPSAEVVRPATGPLSVAEVANHLRNHPPRGLTADDLKINDVLLASAEVVPADLGVSQVVGWGRRFGAAPEAYWRAFRQAALILRMREESASHYHIAARPTRPKPTEGKP